MHPRSLKAGAQPISLGSRREPRPLEVLVSKYFEVPAAGEVPGLMQVEVEDIDARRDMGLFHLYAGSLRQGRPGSKRRDCQYGEK
jgi:hypothetical protein